MCLKHDDWEIPVDEYVLTLAEIPAENAADSETGGWGIDENKEDVQTPESR